MNFEIFMSLCIEVQIFVPLILTTKAGNCCFAIVDDRTIVESLTSKFSGILILESWRSIENEC